VANTKAKYVRLHRDVHRNGEKCVCIQWTAAVPNVSRLKGRKASINDQKGKDNIQKQNQRRRQKGAKEEIRLEIKTTLRIKGKKIKIQKR
jgi:hypothetical protein